MKTILAISALLLLFGAVSAPAETLTLSDCLKRAATANPSLNRAVYDQKVAQEAIPQARSGYLPRIDLQGGYTAQQAPQSVATPFGGFKTQDADYGFFSATLNQTLYDFGRTESRVRRAELLRDAAGHAYAGQEKEVFLQVIETYYGILMDQKLVHAAEQEVEQMGSHLEVARNLFEQGVTTRNDLLQAEVKLAASKQSLLSDNNRLANAWTRLNYLTGRPADRRADLVDTQKYNIEPPPADLDAAIARREEVRSLKNTLGADEETVAESRSGYYPELFARLAADYVKNNEVKEQTIMSATVGVKFNLFDGLATTARYRQSVENRSRTSMRLKEMTAAVRTEYLTAYNDAKAAKERIPLTEEAIKQGEENLRINRDRYQEQVGTATEVIDAQTLLTQARALNYQAVFDFQVAAARVKKALGEL